MSVASLGACVGISISYREGPFPNPLPWLQGCRLLHPQLVSGRRGLLAMWSSPQACSRCGSCSLYNMAAKEWERNLRTDVTVFWWPNFGSFITVLLSHLICLEQVIGPTAVRGERHIQVCGYQRQGHQESSSRLPTTDVNREGEVRPGRFSSCLLLYSHSIWKYIDKCLCACCCNRCVRRWSYI